MCLCNKKITKATTITMNVRNTFLVFSAQHRTMFNNVCKGRGHVQEV